ncbi:MAG: hypothetical protein ACREAC_16425, partial [Blastocatellia bacterium]
LQVAFDLAGFRSLAVNLMVSQTRRIAVFNYSRPYDTEFAPEAELPGIAGELVVVSAKGEAVYSMGAHWKWRGHGSAEERKKG